MFGVPEHLACQGDDDDDDEVEENNTRGTSIFAIHLVLYLSLSLGPTNVCLFLCLCLRVIFRVHVWLACVMRFGVASVFAPSLTCVSLFIYHSTEASTNIHTNTRTRCACAQEEHETEREEEKNENRKHTQPHVKNFTIYFQIVCVSVCGVFECAGALERS